MSAVRLRFLAPMPSIREGAGKWTADLRRIEDLGFHSVVVSEHYSHGWTMDALTAMNFALANTTRLRAMPLMLNNDLHHPAILAKALATADVLSAGRVAVGIGAGWLEDDYKALGVEYHPASLRIARLTEAVQVITAFFAGETVTFDGDHYQLAGLEALPHPAQAPRPPIFVGGGGRKMLALAGRYADVAGLHLILGPGGFDEKAAQSLSAANVGKKAALIAEAAAQAGRATPRIQFTCYDVNIGGVQVTPYRPAFSAYIDAHRGEFAGSPLSLRGDISKCADDLLRWSEELGICYWNLGGNIDAIAPLVSRLASD
jgi:probable F420-dependent oxidoreductase